MAKYEIMIVLDGTLSDSVVNTQLDTLKQLLKKVNKLEVTKLGLKDLAYPIDKKTKGHYFTFNFTNDDASIIAEFRRVTLLNKNVLRHLIINLEKDYGYKWTVNPKKVAKSKFRSERYKKIKAAVMAEQEKTRIAKDTSSVKLTDI